MVNVVALIVRLLQDQGLDFYAELPRGVARPVGRVQENGGFQPSSLMPLTLTSIDVQLETWGETKGDAWELLSDAVDLLHAAPRAHTDLAQGVLTRVEPLGAFYLPDEDWPANGRPGPRYEMTVRITAHG